ncbi:hypothetical protein OYT88_11970 [Sporolactobacillus sp. CQH2019]|uniref:hypothetical protein n=1 Tax=Sporolactobacillus sp. CQH2019 TaxID=3023512 RepID=UPI00236855E0|nr:hypothetical protein [Sporolactobacillus sp. CQH2019]MDD9149271.1 hypothetical protein [Sporolactobacillus sp. CQH2019]
MTIIRLLKKNESKQDNESEQNNEQEESTILRLLIFGPDNKKLKKEGKFDLSNINDNPAQIILQIEFNMFTIKEEGTYHFLIKQGNHFIFGNKLVFTKDED